MPFRIQTQRGQPVGQRRQTVPEHAIGDGDPVAAGDVLCVGKAPLSARQLAREARDIERRHRAIVSAMDAVAHERFGNGYESYKDVAYVTKQCTELARQLAAAA